MNEGIISSPLSMFKTRLTHEEFESQSCDRLDEQNTLVERIVENVLSNINPVIHEHTNQLSNIKNTLTRHTETLANHN